MVWRAVHARVGNHGFFFFAVTEIYTSFSSGFLTMHGPASYLGSHGERFFFTDWASLKSPGNQ